MSLLVWLFQRIHCYSHCNETKFEALAPLSMKVCNLRILSDLAIMFLLIVSSLLLILSGDIHENPGPLSFIPCEKLSLMHLNICSLRKYRDALEVETVRNNFDIITLSETWLNQQICNENILLPGYNLPIRLDRDDGFAGVATYVKSSLVCKQRPDMTIAGLEALWVETKIGQKVLLVGCFYRPPRSPVQYWRLIDESIKKAVNSPHRFVILGDFNDDPWKKSFTSSYEDNRRK